MRIKPPKFWYSRLRPPILTFALYPFSKIYSFFAELRYRSRYDCIEPGIKVIAVGGLTIGGAGKTPVVMALCDLLKKHNAKNKIAAITRGYGRSTKDILKVNAKEHSYVDVGDEALLLARHADDVYVGRNRAECVKIAKKNGCNIAILDDGLSQKYIKPNIKLVVIDNFQKLGNKYMLPFGPNRLNLDIVKRDTDAVIVVETVGSFGIRCQGIDVPEDIPVLNADPKYDFSAFERDEPLMAFCGIGHAEKFFSSISGDLNVVQKIEFPDHYPYSDDEVLNLMDKARLYKLQLVTTEKDLMRINKQYHHLIKCIPMNLTFNDPQAMLAILKARQK